MVGASKILTVSYGTFSCTLEGFEDSFSTMKAIAEYFRDLAADDRYFGAEPATPDAEMLARIAEREIHKRVDAKIEDHGVVLRPSSPKPEIAAEATAPAQPETAAAPAQPAAAAASVPTAFSAPAAAPAVQPEGDGDSVAAKLNRIRAVVARNQGTPPAYAEDQHTDALLTDSEELEEDLPVAPVAFVSTDEVEAYEEETAPDVDIDSAFEDSEALQGASAEASLLPEADEADEADAEFESADTTDEEPEPVAEDAAEQIEPEADQDFEDEAVPPVEIDDFSGVISQVGAEEPGESLNADTGDAEEKAAEELPEEDAPRHDQGVTAAAAQRARTRVIKMKKADFDAAVSSGALNDLAETDSPKAAGEISEDSSLSEEDEANLMQELASLEDEDEDVGVGFDANAEADADAEASDEEETEDDSQDDDSTLVQRDVRKGRDILATGSAEDEASVARLLEETNTHLENPETSRRRSAISHLRAAVAATVADRIGGSGARERKDDQTDAYRADLASVVRPRRQETKDHETTSEGVSPLVLVSEQRIDRPQPAPVMSKPAAIRPRRVRKGAALALREVDEDFAAEERASDEAAANNIFAENISFVAFAENHNATELPDLLEAAAAYVIFVEGRPHFSRPQVMGTVAKFVGRENFVREDALRAFGQLLRQNNIIKIKRGHFELAGDTRFKPDAIVSGE